MQLNRTLIMTLTAVVAALSALWFTTGAVTPFAGDPGKAPINRR